MCFGAKWLGEKGTRFRAEWEDGDKMVPELHDLLNEADAVLHWNGTRFDIPHIQRAFMEAGLGPTSPFKQIDLMKTAKKQARFLSNKLDHVSQQVGLRGKEKHEGFRLWTSCMDGDKKAQKRMKSYNIRDVVMLEEVYAELLPWISSHPSHAAKRGEDCCPRCGSDHLQRRGYATTATGRYARLQCVDCGGWSRETRREAKAGVVAL